MIIGKVKFYGISDKSDYSKIKKAYVKTGEKEIHLSIENPKVTDTAIEKAKSFYDGTMIPKWLDEYLENGKSPDILHFKTALDYEPKYVYIKKDNEIIKEDINNINMHGAEIAMIYNGPYIGKILIIKNGEEEKCPFDNIDNLPFK